MQNEKNKNQRSFQARFDMRGLLERRDLIVLTGDSRATLYGCRRILLYSPIEIRLCIGRREVSLEGEGLLCTCFSAGSVTVEGHITAVRYHAPSRVGGTR